MMKTPVSQFSNPSTSAVSRLSERDGDHTLPIPLTALAIVSLLLTVTVGGSLFFFPEAIQLRWVWPLKPYNTRFLGAIYLTAAVGFVSLLSNRRSGLARLIVPMFFVFTTNALMVSCLQLQQFGAERRATDAWFWLYLLDCVGSTYYLSYYKSQTFAGVRSLSKRWSTVLGVQAGFLFAYGFGLLFLPVAMGSRWLWPLDVFHSQLYSSIFLTSAVGAAILSRRATAVELRTLGGMQIAFSILSTVGVLWVDRQVRGIDWSLLANWVWMGAIALLGIIGLGLVWQSRSFDAAHQRSQMG